MINLKQIQARDVIALFALGCCFTLLYLGRDGIVTATTCAIIGYYFSKRVYEEKKK